MTQKHLENDLEKQMCTVGFRYSWPEMEAPAQERDGWKQVDYGRCSTGSYRAEVRKSQLIIYSECHFRQKNSEKHPVTLVRWHLWM